MAGYAKEIDVVDESEYEIQRVLQEKDAQNTAWKILIKDWQGYLQIIFFIFCTKILVFRYNISFIDPPLGGFGEIFPSVMIFPSG